MPGFWSSFLSLFAVPPIAWALSQLFKPSATTAIVVLGVAVVFALIFVSLEYRAHERMKDIVEGRQRVDLYCGTGPGLIFMPPDGRKRSWIRLENTGKPIKNFSVRLSIWSLQGEEWVARNPGNPMALMFDELQKSPFHLEAVRIMGLFHQDPTNEDLGDNATFYMENVRTLAVYKGDIEPGRHRVDVILSGEEIRPRTYKLEINWTGDWSTYDVKPLRQPKGPDRIHHVTRGDKITQRGV
ncbi:hypothetical protein [Enterovirga rhinocerotis]|nr:hypothetical protein [Enterovirga rhinocerotis]